MSAMTSQITGVSIVYSTVCSGVGQRKHQSFAPLTFVRGNHRGDWWFPSWRFSNTENVSNWWRLHVILLWLYNRCLCCPYRHILHGCLNGTGPAVLLQLNCSSSKEFYVVSDILPRVFGSRFPHQVNTKHHCQVKPTHFVLGSMISQGRAQSCDLKAQILVR